MEGVREVLNLIFAITEIGDNGKKLHKNTYSIPLIITTLGILGASVRTCESLSAYVLPHTIPVSRLENLYVYLTTTY